MTDELFSDGLPFPADAGIEPSKPTTFYQLLYAQALQIAVALKGEKFNPNAGGDGALENFLDGHRMYAERIYRYLRRQPPGEKPFN